MIQSRHWLLTALASLTLAAAPLIANAQKAMPATTKTATFIAPVNVNTATTAQLETLTGIGPKIAAEIIKNRPYKSGKELQSKVKGIGPTVWNDIKKYVTFK